MRYLGKVNFPPQVRRKKNQVHKAQEKSQEDLQSNSSRRCPETCRCSAG